MPTSFRTGDHPAPAGRRDVDQAEDRFADLLVALNSLAPSRWQAGGITPQQLHLMLELSATGTLRPMQLAERMGLHVSTLTGITDRLTERGLVSRRPAADDRRCSDLSLTAEGERAMRDLVSGGCVALRAGLAALGSPRVAQLERLLAELADEVRNLPNTPSAALSAPDSWLGQRNPRPTA